MLIKLSFLLEEVISVKHYPWKVTNLLSKDVEPITDRRWEGDN